MNRPIRKIVRELADSEKFQVEWDRQLVTAEKIASRHEEGLTTVLLADEVGMGKTYVALATIANHVFQTDENNSKVLLVVPPNNILARKWEQEIRTFNEKYLHESLVEDKAKSLRPMLVTDYWDLIQNLHNFQNQATPRVSERMRQCFAFAVSKWNDGRREKRKWKREWVAYGDLKNHSLEYLGFCSLYSPRAIADFLDEKFSSNTSAMTKMVKDLNEGDLGKGSLNDLFKEFANKQDFFEANVFVIGMATLRRTRQDKEESTLLSTYIASCLLKNYWEDTKKAALKQLAKYSFFYVPESMAKCGNPHLRWFADLGAINLWGMYDPVWKVIESRGDRKHLVDRILEGADLDGLFKELQAQVINLKLGESGIGLAVVDEVHNWKNGNNGAREFQERYAPRIPKKLIMSATPFQLHQDELGNVFRCAAGVGDSSIKVVDNLLLHNGLANTCLDASELFLLAWNALGKEDHLQLVLGMESCDDVSSAFDAMRRQADLSEPLVRLLGGIDRYRAAIQTLQVELSKIVIRHTKNRDKRHFHAGREYTAKGMPGYSKIRRTLYAVPGYGASTNALVNFLAMRIDQLVRRDTHTTGYESNAHLLGGITSSNQAFIDSNGKLLANDKITPATKDYLRFFETALQKNQHPKVEATIERAFENFRMGNKTLIFCERLGTQKEILAALAILINEKVFPNGGIEQAKKDRESILKDHQAVELFWTRSYLAKLDPSTHDKLKWHLLEQSTDLIARVSLKIAELGGHANQRQVFKLLDLAMLQEIGYQQGGQLELVGSLFDANIDALKLYLRMKNDPESVSIDDDPLDNEEDLSNLSAGDLEQILEAPSIWYSSSEPALFHKSLWLLIDSEMRQLSGAGSGDYLEVVAGILLDLGQGLRKILLRLDVLQGIEQSGDESLSTAAIRMLCNQSDARTWDRTRQFVEALLDGEGTVRRKSARSSKRQSLWRGVFMREGIASELNGSVAADTRVNLCAAFNSPLLPHILVCTSIGSEGIDLHLHCADIIHHDLPWNPAKLEQRTGRVDRVGSLAEKLYVKDRFRLNIGIPFLAHNYEKFQYEQLLLRAQKFEILMGKPEFPTDVEEEQVDETGTEMVLETADREIEGHVDEAICLPDKIVEYLKMDLSVYRNHRCD